MIQGCMGQVKRFLVFHIDKLTQKELQETSCEASIKPHSFVRIFNLTLFFFTEKNNKNKQLKKCDGQILISK